MKRLRKVEIDEIFVSEGHAVSGRVLVDDKPAYFLLVGPDHVPGSPQEDLKYMVFPVSEEEWAQIYTPPHTASAKAARAAFDRLAQLHHEITLRKPVGWFFGGGVVWPRNRA